VLTRKDFMGAFEICFYGWKEGAGISSTGRTTPPTSGTSRRSTRRHGAFDREAGRAGGARDPVLVAPGENVLDLFGGSGSTLIGCEQTGRRAFLMELDPAYCDVIVQRWEQFTGRKAERIQAVTNAPVVTEASVEA
jgi:hypothetical protein